MTATHTDDFIEEMTAQLPALRRYATALSGSAAQADDDALSDESIDHFVQIDGLIFERPPQALDEDIVHAPSAAIHRDRDASVFEHAGELEAGELAAQNDR